MRNFDLDWDYVGKSTEPWTIINAIVAGLYAKAKREIGFVDPEVIRSVGRFDVNPGPEELGAVLKLLPVDTLYIDGVPNGLQADIMKKYFPGIRFILMGTPAEEFKRAGRNDLLSGLEVYDSTLDETLESLVRDIFQDLKESEFQVKLLDIELGILFQDIGKKLIYEVKEDYVEIITETSEGQRVCLNYSHLEKKDLYKRTLALITAL